MPRMKHLEAIRSLRDPLVSVSLHERAMTFHRQTLGSGCDCLEERSYPCADCATEIERLVELLDEVARDAIDVTCRAWERAGHVAVRLAPRQQES